EFRPPGSLRGYARVRESAVMTQAHRLAPRELIDAGSLSVMLEQDEESATYQGVVPLDGATLAACAQSYFATSEQTETRIRLAVGEVFSAGAAHWRAGGLLMQK